MINSLKSSSHDVPDKGIQKSTIKHAIYCFLLPELWSHYFCLILLLLYLCKVLIFFSKLAVILWLSSQRSLPARRFTSYTTLPCVKALSLFWSRVAFPEPDHAKPQPSHQVITPIWGSLEECSQNFFLHSSIHYLNPIWHSADWSFRPAPSTMSPRQVSLLLPRITYYLCTLCNVQMKKNPQQQSGGNASRTKFAFVMHFNILRTSKGKISPSNFMNLAFFAYFHHIGQHTIKNTIEECCI